MHDETMPWFYNLLLAGFIIINVLILLLSAGLTFFILTLPTFFLFKAGGRILFKKIWLASLRGRKFTSALWYTILTVAILIFINVSILFLAVSFYFNGWGGIILIFWTSVHVMYYSILLSVFSILAYKGAEKRLSAT